MSRQTPLFSRQLFFVLAIAVIVFGAVVSYRVHERDRAEAIAEAAETLQVSMTAFVGALDQVFEPALVLGETIDDAFLWRVEGDAEVARMFFGAMTGPVSRFRQINGAFIGFPDGRFLHVQDIRVTDSKSQEQRRVQGIRRRSILSPQDDPVGSWEVFSRASKRWLPEATAAEPYDPRSRPWYTDAVANGAPMWSDAYIFSSSGQPGVTYAKPIFDGEGKLWAVMGVDLTLSALSKVLVGTVDMLSQSHDVVFATDFSEKILGHPDLLLKTQGNAAGMSAGIGSYTSESGVEREIIDRVRDQGRAVTFDYDGTTYVAVKGLLDTAKAMPLQVYVGRDVKTLLNEAREVMLTRVLIVFAAVSILGLILLYAIKLRVEVKARKQAEAELVAAKDVAEAATKAKSTFLATMSHEIRTPMNGVLSMVELLSLSRLDSEQRRMTRVISDSANALLTILNDILDMSKIEAGKIEIETVPFSLSQLVDGAAELLASRANEGGVLLIVGMDPALPDNRLGDPTRLRQILLNLASNGLKFTAEGQVEIRVLTAAGERVRFEVHDTGIGLTKAQKDKLFQAFVQADASTSRRFGGTGLGLSISRKLCGLMGGAIGVESEPDVGSCFWFEVPLPTENADLVIPRFDLTALRYRLGALPERVSTVLQAYLQDGGVQPASEAEWMAGDTAVLFLANAWADPQETAHAFGTGVASSRKLALVGPRSRLQSLDPVLASLDPILLSTPFSRASVWHAAAVALGLETEETPDRNHDLEFAPPDIETARAGQALVLVAEDNETNRIVAGQMLSRMGYACEMAENGAVALEMWRQRDGYGLLLSDLNMPELDGLGLSTAIRDAEEASGTEGRLPIIALTADVLSEAAEACRAAGMDEVLLKPIESGKLAEAIARLMPQGMPLRQVKDLSPASETSDGTADEEAWDNEILDLSVLAEAFGNFNDDAWTLVRTAPDLWETRIAEINAGLAAGDIASARTAAHSLKGVALSLGANRMGRIASDIQDALDADSAEFAEMLAEVLLPTLEEFKLVVGQIESSRSASGTG